LSITQISGEITVYGWALTKGGRQPAFVDGQIAAIAKVNQLILVTRNTADYEGFSDLQIENWHE
jgi:tRNA(fMet)-specific endonuclease VapC